MDISAALPVDIQVFFENRVKKDVSTGDGSLLQTHVDGSDLLDYRKSAFCVPSLINNMQQSCIEGVGAYFSQMRWHLLLQCSKHSIPTLYLKMYPWCTSDFMYLEVFNEIINSSESKESALQLCVLIGLELVAI